MTTYTTPHFANGLSDRNVRPSDKESNTTRARTASPVYKTAAVSNEGALLADAHTPDWQPNKSKGVPKAAIGVLGAALIGGVAVAALMLAPADKVTKTVMPDPIAAAATQSTATNADATTNTADAAVSQIDQQAPAAGPTTTPAAAADNAAMQSAAMPAPAAPALVAKTPVITAPVARLPQHRTVAPTPAAAPVATSPAAAMPAPVVTPDQPVATPSVAPQQPDSSTPAMQQTPAAPTVTPATPAPTVDPTPVTPVAPDSGSNPGGNQ